MKNAPQRIVKNGQTLYLHKYEVALPYSLIRPDAPEGAELIDLELYCYRIGWSLDNGGLGRYEHFRNVCSILLPKLEWNPWLEWAIESLCNDGNARRLGKSLQREVCWAGSASAGKTFAIALFIFIDWLSAPGHTISILTSTSAKMIRKRMWPVLAKLYREVRERFGPAGHIVDSKTMIQASRGDDMHAITAIAVGKGETNKAAANIQGQHAPRMRVILDEATDVEDAILVAVENLKMNCDDYLEVRIGNAKSRIDALGQAMEPKDGWNSVTVDDEEWETKRGGICLHFDGFKSPNVKAGKTIYRHIYSFEDYQRALDKDQKSLSFWMYDRGFPPPDGVTNTVLSEALIIQNCSGSFTFLSTVQTIASLDPGFGGDACILLFAQLGDLDSGDGKKRFGIQLGEKIEIHPDMTSKTPRDYQIARRVIAECKSRNVTPRAFGMDSTGTGRGVYAIICEEWDSSILKVEFGGDPSSQPSSEADPRPGKEVYDRRVTELWFTIKAFVQAKLIKGLDRQMIQQLTTRIYDDERHILWVEPKEDYKSRMGRSPDEADALAVLVEVARSLGAAPVGGLAVKNQDNWNQQIKKLDSIYVDESEEELQLSVYGGWWSE